MDMELKGDIAIISTEEYARLREIQKHYKEVKIIEKIEGENRSACSIYWKSDGKCWMYLAEKIRRQNKFITDLIVKNDEAEEKIKKLEKTIKRLEKKKRFLWW